MKIPQKFDNLFPFFERHPKRSNHPGKKKAKESKGKGAHVATDKLKFAIGDNQAENCERLKKELAQQAQKDYGAKMAQLSLTEEECDLSKEKPTMKLGTIVITAKSTDEEKLKKEREDKQIEADYIAAKKTCDTMELKYKQDKDSQK